MVRNATAVLAEAEIRTGLVRAELGDPGEALAARWTTRCGPICAARCEPLFRMFRFRRPARPALPDSDVARTAG